MPLAAGGNDRPRQQQGRIEGNQNGQEANAGANERGGRNAANAQGQSAEPTPPTPQDLADRLLRERREGSLFRRAERAIALFVASLVPGVGERHIAARDAAEARRLAQEQEREVHAQQERENQEEREMEVQDRVRRESTVVLPAIVGRGGALAWRAETILEGVVWRERGINSGSRRHH